MPVLEFANNWRDIRFREAGADSSPSSQDSGAHGDGNPKPVLSFYFWIYLAISNGLTIVTVFGWWRYTKTVQVQLSEDKGIGRRKSFVGGRITNKSSKHRRTKHNVY